MERLYLTPEEKAFLEVYENQRIHRFRDILHYAELLDKMEKIREDKELEVLEDAS